MTPLTWAVVLLLLGLALVLLEVFVPSGGVIGVLAVLAVMGSVVMAFVSGSPATGFTFLLIALVAMPSAFSFAIKIWPETPMGRRILIQPPKGDDVLPDHPQRRQLQALVGKIGRAKSLMLPSGAAEIAGRTVDAVSEGMTIEAGTLVRVVEVRGSRVVVRPAEGEVPDPGADDELSRPIESLGLDPFQDPIA